MRLMNRKTNSLIAGILGSVFIILSTPVRSEVVPTANQLMLLQGRVDQLQVNYIFGFENNGESAEAYSAPLMLPREMTDFQVLRGADPSEVKTNADGRLILEKTIEPGKLSVEIGFFVPAESGTVHMTLQPSAPIQNLAFIWNKTDGLSIDSEGFAAIPPPGGETDRFQGFRYTGHAGPGETIEVTLSGLPLGRTQFWILGGAFGLVLCCFAFFFAWRSKPEDQQYVLETAT